jgi:hypothetical protein
MQYSLMTFGIQLNELLASHGKSRHSEIHQQYTRQRLDIERKRNEEEKLESAKTGIVQYPNPNDVLVVRGRSYREFSGNLQWSQLIDSRLESYRDCNDKFAKTCISMDVARTV